MARTTFSGPVASDNGFIGDVVGDVSATVLTASSATISNLIATSGKISNVTYRTASAVSGVVSAQLGYVPVLVGSTTAYIALYKSVTL